MHLRKMRRGSLHKARDSIRKDAIEDWGDEYTGQQSGSAMGGGRRLSRRRKSK